MQEMGLEPTRYCYHRHLKPARLPIPPLLQTNIIITFFFVYVNKFFEYNTLNVQFYQKPHKKQESKMIACKFAIFII